MNKKKILFILIFFIAISIGVFIYFKTKTNIPLNDDHALGNTSGNLYNGGFLSESNGIIYFSNPYDEGKLYSMKSDCTDAKKLSDSHVASINVQGNYIYYVKNTTNFNTSITSLSGKLKGIYRCNLDGTNEVSLSDKLTGIISLSGNHIFYQLYDKKSGTSLYKIRTNKSENKQISKTEVNPSSIYNGVLYFSNNADNHNIYTMDITSNTKTFYFNSNTDMTNMQGNFLYYIDLSRGSSLVRLNTSNQIVELLSSGQCINFNIYDNKIFYQKDGEDAGLYRMNLDGSNKEHIVTGDFINILCTSQYTFFQFANNPGMLYRVPTSSAITKIEEITIK